MSAHLLSSVLGIDTHKYTHVAVLLDGLGRHRGQLQVPATDAGAAQLLAWSHAHGQPLVAGVEGTGSYGYQLTRALQAAALACWRSTGPTGRTGDARARATRSTPKPLPEPSSAARRPPSPRTAKVPSRPCALSMARKSAVKATTQASNQIKALLVGSPQALRDDLVVRSLLQLATRCAQLPGPGGLQVALRSLGRRWLLLHEEILTLDTEIRRLVRTTAAALLDRCGIGIHSAAQLIITAGGNPTRLHSDAAFAALCGVSPVQASSGLRQRHRLNRGGDRDANNALWTIANNRLIHDPRSRAYADKRTAQGDTRKDTLRMLKRYIAREVLA